jgi:MFS transporter, DHA1 family, inner membrane transport protein
VRGQDRLVGALVIVSFASLLYHLAFSPLLPLIAADLNVGVPLLGQVPAASVLLAGTLGLVIGPLSDLYGHARAIRLGGLSIAISAIGMGLSPGYLTLLFFGLVGALGRATVQPIAMALVGAQLSPESARHAVGWIQVSASCSAILGIPMLAILSANAGWRAGFLALGALAVLALIVSSRLPAAPPSTAAGRGLASMLTPYRPLLRHRPTVGVIGATLLSSAGFTAVFTHVAAFFRHRHDLTTEQIGISYAISGLGLIAGNLLAARRLSGVPLRPLLAVTLLARGLVFAAVVLAPVGPIATVLLFTAVGFADGLTFVVAPTLLSRESPTGRGTTMALNGTAHSFGTALGGALGGLGLALGGYAYLGLLSMVFGTAAALLASWSGRSRRPASHGP